MDKKKELEPIPSGTYKADISGVDIKDCHGIVKFKITEGKQKGKVLFYKFSSRFEIEVQQELVHEEAIKNSIWRIIQ